MKSYDTHRLTPKDDPKGKQFTAADAIGVRGTDKPPLPPRSLMAQAGARKAVLSWDLPDKFWDIDSWQVAKGTESNIVASINDVNTRTYDLSLNAGATPPVTIAMVRSVNKLGASSRWASTSAVALAEAGAPTDPTPPPTTSGGGGDTGGGGRCFSGDVRVRLIDGPTAFNDMLWRVQLENGMWAKHIVSEYRGWMVAMPTGGLATPKHPFMHANGLWVPATEYFGRGAHIYYCGQVHNLEVETEDEELRWYLLESGDKAHNLSVY